MEAYFNQQFILQTATAFRSSTNFFSELCRIFTYGSSQQG